MLVPLQQWESCKQQFDLVFTSYPLSYFTDTDHVIYNPLVLSESSLSCVSSHLIERYRFQKALERLFMESCLAHTGCSIIKGMMENSEAVIPYRYGIGCMIISEEKGATRIVMYVADDIVTYRSIQYRMVCAVHIKTGDSLHLIDRPLRMILQDATFAIRLGRMKSDEQLRKAMKEALSRLHKAVY